MRTYTKKMIRAIFTVAILVSVPQFALADYHHEFRRRVPEDENRMPPPPDGMPPMGIQSPLILDNLNLSEEQQKKIGDMLQNQINAVFEKQHSIKKIVMKMRELSASEEYEVAKVKSMADELGKAVSELSLLQAEIRAKMYSVLTVEQRKQFLRN